MDRPSQSPVWPFLIVVGILFLLCIVAPREWERIAREHPSRVSSVLAERDADSRSVPWPAIPIEEEAVSDYQVQGGGIEAAAAPVDVLATSTGTELFPTVVESPAPAPESPTADEQPQVQVAVEASEMAVQPTLVVEEPSAEQPKPAAPIETRLTNVLRPEAENAPTDKPAPELERPAAPQATLVAQPAENPAPSAKRHDSQWAVPEDLLERLETLACECDCTDWSMRVEQLILELCDHTNPTDARAQKILAQLRTAAGEVDGRIPQIAERSVAIELLRVRHGLVRRLDVWELMPAAFEQKITAAGPSDADVKRLTAALDRLDEITRAAGAEGEQWRRYLALDALRALVKNQISLSESDSRRLAREIQLRLERPDLTYGQRTFISSRPVAELGAALRSWSLDPFDPTRLLADLERFETSNQPSDARRVADDYIESVSLVVNGSELAQRLETNYRNANLRFALSEKLLKRLLPGATMTTDPVRDEVLGHPTRGVSTTSTTVDVKLVPDARRLRVALEASGKIFANTRSTSGPATLHTQSNSSYHARKLVDLDLRGIRTWPAESECIDTRTQLRSVSTDFDGVPLVGALVENFARSKHADQENEVRSVVRRKVETQARRKMDSITEERLERVNQLLQNRVLKPLDALSLDPQMISAETSEQRLTMRLRIAGEEQLAGHTPRPRAPGDSLLSLQLHQSLFNNICEKLYLSGRTFTLPELRDHLNESLNLENSRFMDATDKDVSITFADQDAVRVFCEHGRVELELAVARLSNAERTWKNFRVRVFYRPEVEGLQARLVRDGTVQVIGSRLAGQIPLRGIFSKAFAKDRELVLIDPKWSSDERTRDLAFSQFVIQDGWIAVSVAEPRQNVARQPQPASAQ